MFNNSILPLLLLLAWGGCNNCNNDCNCNNGCVGDDNCACRRSDCGDLLAGCLIGMMCNNSCCAR